MRAILISMALVILGSAVLSGCGSASSGPSGDQQMDKYNENLEKAKKLGGEESGEQGE